MSSVSSPPGVRARSFSRPVFDPAALFPRNHPSTPSSKWRALRCARRLLLVLIWGIGCCVVQSVLIVLPGTGKVRFARLFWKIVCDIMGIKVRVLGTMASTVNAEKPLPAGRKPVAFVSNHSSWLDVLALGGTLPAIFVAKQEVKGWPLIGIVTRLGRTVYVSRNRQETGHEVQDMLNNLRLGQNIIFFPEGTSSDGSRVLPFLSSLFAVAKPLRSKRHDDQPSAPPLLIQPVSVVYDQLEGLPVGRSRRASVFSWFGDMDLAPHLWALGQWRSMRVTILLHPPLDPDNFPSRKRLANAAYDIIRQGAENLRQGRIIETEETERPDEE